MVSSPPKGIYVPVSEPLLSRARDTSAQTANPQPSKNQLSGRTYHNH